MDETIDLGALREGIRDMLAVECPRELVVRHAQQGDGIDRALWAKAVKLGLTLTTIPEENGGLGLGLEAAALLHEEAGRAAAPLPLLSCTLAVECLIGSTSGAQRDQWLPRIAEGAVIAIAAPTAIAATAVSISQSGNTIVLDGEVRDLLDGADADLALLTAKDAAGRTYRVMIDIAADGVVPSRETLWDRSRSLSHLALEKLALPADRAWLTSEETETTLVNHAAVALAADSLGGQEALLELTIEYLKTRQQFGRAIGSFQALKHRVADHSTRLEGGRWLYRSAVSALASGLDFGPAEASSAKAHLASDYAELGRDATQLHGGIGFTAEYPCHVYMKRALLNEQLFGSSAYHVDRAAATILAGAA